MVLTEQAFDLLLEKALNGDLAALRAWPDVQWGSGNRPSYITRAQTECEKCYSDPLSSLTAKEHAYNLAGLIALLDERIEAASSCFRKVASDDTTLQRQTAMRYLFMIDRIEHTRHFSREIFRGEDLVSIVALSGQERSMAVARRGVGAEFHQFGDLNISAAHLGSWEAQMSIIEKRLSVLGLQGRMYSAFDEHVGLFLKERLEALIDPAQRLISQTFPEDRQDVLRKGARQREFNLQVWKTSELERVFKYSHRLMKTPGLHANTLMAATALVAQCLQYGYGTTRDLDKATTYYRELEGKSYQPFLLSPVAQTMLPFQRELVSHLNALESDIEVHRKKSLINCHYKPAVDVLDEYYEKIKGAANILLNNPYLQEADIKHFDDSSKKAAFHLRALLKDKRTPWDKQPLEFLKWVVGFVAALTLVIPAVMNRYSTQGFLGTFFYRKPNVMAIHDKTESVGRALHDDVHAIPLLPT